MAAVAVKLPTFWAENAAVWFVQTEAQFAMRNVTNDDTKYYHVVSALDQQTASRVLDTLQAPPEENKYANLKQRLLGTFTLTESQRAAALLNVRGLGDTKPSELMDKMLGLLGSHKPCFLFRELFLQQLPVEVRTHLSTSTETDLRALALEADTVWFSRLNQTVSSATIDQHSSEICRVGKGPKPTKQDHKVTNTGFCYYHHRFGSAAQQCRAPCTFTNQGNGQPGRR